MLGALLYLQYHSIKNRLVRRIKRLKQPKYLAGGIVGGLYFYFYFGRYVFGMGGRRQSVGLVLSPENHQIYESLGALVLFTFVVVAWVVPHERAALAFSEAEVAFLFPAPISRRWLIHFKLLRSQTAILLTTLLLTFITRRFGGNVAIRATGWWLILSMLNLHLLGSSFGRTMLLERGITNWQRRTGVLVMVGTLAGLTLFWARRTMPALDLSALTNLEDLKAYFHQITDSGPAPYLLYPFRLVVRPFLAPDGAAFIRALGPALVLLALHYGWVVRSNVAFEEASVEASKKLAERVASIRAGQWQGRRQNLKGKRAPFRLRPSGPVVIGFLWKNLISAGQAFTLRLWILLAALAVGASAGFGRTSGRSGALDIVGMFAAMLLVWSLILGAQFFRQDFRQDLLRADILKTYPLRGWQIALGELLAPAAILTGIQWFLLILAAGLCLRARDLGLGPGGRLGIGLGAALVVPVLNLITLQIPNAAVLLFPAWFQMGREGAHGIEATGQRLIFMLGQLLVFVLTLVPAAAIFAGAFFLGQLALGLTLAIPLASLAAAIVLAVEASVGVLLLGWLFERFDVAGEQPSG